MSLALIVAIALARAADLSLPAQVPAPGGAASVAGRVTETDARGTVAPVRRARVTLTQVDGANGYTVTTDEDGRFQFADVLAGRYLLAADKGGWLRSVHGAKRPGRPGTAIPLAVGQRLTDVSLTMTRGAVIAGTVRDDRGQPAQGLAVAAALPIWRDGERVLEPPALTAYAYTDGAGEYRLFGLPAGDYIVMSAPRTFGPTPATEYQLLAAADVDRLLQANFAATGTAPVPRPASATRSTAGEFVRLAPVAFPAASDPALATPVKVAAGEERLGIDLTMPLVATTRISGVVTAPDGTPRPGVMVALVWTGHPIRGNLEFISPPTARTDQQGRYRLDGVLPGAYELLAFASLAPPPPPAPPGTIVHDAHGEGPMLWAQQEVRLAGGEREIPLALQPSMTIRGRVAFETSGPQPTGSAPLQVRLTPVGARVNITELTEAPVDDRDGSFQFVGVGPGRYRLSLLPSTAGRWVAKSSIARGQDSLDVPIEIRAGDNITDWVLTLSDRPSELRGSFTDAAGLAAPDYTVVVFAADRAFWTASSRRIVGTRPSGDGTFSIKGLPTGEYLLAALTDVEPGEWMSPAFLDGLVASAVRVPITHGETTTRDLRVSGR